MKIGIAGAGASGMMAAIAAAQKGVEVTLLEKNDRVGKKLLATGNGKCNLGNLDFSVDKYYCRDKERLGRLFDCFSVKETIAFFQENGLLLRDREGYLYPYSEQASTVLDVFRRLLAERKIRIVTGACVRKAVFDREWGVFRVFSDKESFVFDRLVLSCGGPAGLKQGDGMSGFALAERFGHSIAPIAPGLVQLRSGDSFLKPMAGVRAKGEAVLWLNGAEAAREQGEIQFTEYGISGIPVFQMSRTAAYGVAAGCPTEVSVNFFPQWGPEEFEERIRHRYERMENASLEEFLLGTCHKKINQALVKKEGLRPGDRIDQIGLSKIRRLMQNYQKLVIRIEKPNSMEHAQVCAGGVGLDQVDGGMQSLLCPGLYLTGELLDVDGRCGGYNLQWAWTSGYIAGRNAGCSESIS